MPRDPDCLFCKIVSSTIPASVVHETDDLIAFLDIHPLADGHLLVVPREHYTQLDLIPGDVCARVCSALPALGRALLTATGAAGFNVLQSNGRAAGQVVGHVHFHLIPRRPVDELGFRWHAGSYAPGRDVEILAAYRQALGDDG